MKHPRRKTVPPTWKSRGSTVKMAVSGLQEELEFDSDASKKFVECDFHGFWGTIILVFQECVPVVPDVGSDWLEKSVIAGFRVWQLMFMSGAGATVVSKFFSANDPP